MFFFLPSVCVRLLPQGAIIVKLLGSCQGCREGGPVGIVEQRRRGLQVKPPTIHVIMPVEDFFLLYRGT